MWLTVSDWTTGIVGKISLKIKGLKFSKTLKTMAKRHADNVSIGDVLKEFIQANRLEKGLDKVNAKEAWDTVMGNAISKYTTGLRLDKDTLTVQLSSSVLREELSYGKDKIIKLLNEELGKEMIKKLILR